MYFFFKLIYLLIWIICIIKFCEKIHFSLIYEKFIENYNISKRILFCTSLNWCIIWILSIYNRGKSFQAWLTTRKFKYKPQGNHTQERTTTSCVHITFFYELSPCGNNSPNTVSCQHHLERFSSGKSYNVKSHSFLNSSPVVTIAPTQSHANIVSSDSRQVNLTMLKHSFLNSPPCGNNSPDTVSCQHRLKRFSSGKSYNVKSHSFLNSPSVVTIAQTRSHASIVSSDSRQVNLTMLNHIHFWTLPLW